MAIWIVLLFSAVFAKTDPDALRPFPELCQAYGFQVETYNITTDDGYILTVFRIPGLLGEEITLEKPVIFMQHGLIDSADTFIVNDYDKAPGFILARRGFDVWFGNSRGSRHSRAHVSLDPNHDKIFWQFSWQHMADHDLPAVLDFVAKTTKKKITYIGHSQGTTQMFAALSENSKVASYLNLFVALAPVASTTHVDSITISMLKDSPLLSTLKFLGIYEFFPADSKSIIFYYVCSFLKLACADAIKMVSDYETVNDNVDRFPVILSHYPSGSSIMNMEHWVQGASRSEYAFAKFDYGSEEVNMAVYGQPVPPKYDLSKISVPMALYLGIYDRLADSKDGAWLLSQLNPEYVVKAETDLEFGHATFIWGKDASYLDGVIELVREYGSDYKGFLEAY